MQKNNINISIAILIAERYSDIANVFFELFDLNWPDCPYKRYIISDYDVELITDNDELYIRTPNMTLPECIKDICGLYEVDYLICMLGDALITKPVKQNLLSELLSYMVSNKMDYCNILGNLNCNKKICRRLKFDEPYGVEFISFIASKDYIIREFKEGVSDIDFENKYLKIGMNCNSRSETMVVANSNIMNIMHGVNKGLWIRKVYKYIKRNYPNICMEKRRRQSIRTEIYEDVSLVVGKILSIKMRSYIRRFIKVIHPSSTFYTKY